MEISKVYTQRPAISFCAIMNNLPLLSLLHMCCNLAKVACSRQVEHDILSDAGEVVEYVVKRVWLHGVEVEDDIRFVAWTCDSSALHL